MTRKIKEEDKKNKLISCWLSVKDFNSVKTFSGKSRIPMGILFRKLVLEGIEKQIKESKK